jgi:hypothetical protein
LLGKKVKEMPPKKERKPTKKTAIVEDVVVPIVEPIIEDVVVVPAVPAVIETAEQTYRPQPEPAQPPPQNTNTVPSTLFITSILSKTVSLPITEVGKNLKEVLRNKVAELVEAKCIVEGYVKQHSVQILSYSCGLVRANDAVFNVSYSCEVFLPCAGMVLDQCVVTEILESAGIELKSNQSPNIFVVYVYQDHNFEDKEFKGRVGDTAAIHVIDYRFEIYDEYITIMGEIV